MRLSTPPCRQLLPGAGWQCPCLPLAVPVVAPSLSLVSFGVQAASNSLSRADEPSADAYSLNLTGDPAAFIAVERKLTVDNVGDPDPPALLQLMFGTHPTTMDRIGAALTWSRGRD